MGLYLNTETRIRMIRLNSAPPLSHKTKRISFITKAPTALTSVRVKRILDDAFSPIVQTTMNENTDENEDFRKLFQMWSVFRTRLL